MYRLKNIVMKNVLLIGIDGCYNYGCEAIVRGTVNILKSIDSAINVSYASYNYDDDVKRLANCDVHILARPRRKRWTFRNIVRKGLSFLGIKYHLQYDSIGWLKGFDTLFSIGGDIYTLSSDGKYNQALPLFLEKCQQRGLSYVLWGASVGKFEKNPVALTFFCSHLLKTNLIVARERITIDYLKSLNIVQNVCFAPDPAFFVEYPKLDEYRQKDHRLTIGINLSPMSALYEYENLDIAIQRQSKAIINLIELMQCNVMLLPHVISPNPQDNDFIYLQKIYDKVKVHCGSAIMLVDNDPGFVGLKLYIKQCDYVIAARMHCAVNAITVSVPTLFLSYSEKAKGMADFVYNSNETVVSLADFENISLIVEKLKNWHWNSNIDEIRKFNFNKILK